MTKQSKVDPGRRSTREEAQKDDAEALAYLKAIKGRNRPWTKEYIRDNPLGVGAQASLPFVRNRVNPQGQHKDSLAFLMEKADFENVAEVEEIASSIIEKHGRKSVTEAISRAKKKKAKK